MKLLYLAPDVKALELLKAVAALGPDVRVAIPLAGDAPGTVLTKVAVPTVHGPLAAEVYASKRGRVTVYSIAAARPGRGKPALSADEQTIFFALAAVALCRALDWAPDVMHALDPAYGAAIYWLATDGLRDEFYGDVATALTVADVEVPFVSARAALKLFGLTPADAPGLPDAARASLAGLALAYAGGVIAYSPDNGRYALRRVGKEPAPTGREEAPRPMVGIAPTVDAKVWNPARDAALKQRFDAEHLDRRAANKRALQQALKLPLATETPVLALLTEHETPASLALALPAVRDLLASGAAVQVVLAGPTPPEVAAELKALARAYSGQVAATPRSDANLTRRVLAGADFYVSAAFDAATRRPARLAQRYGAVPIVHSLNAPPPHIVTPPAKTANAFVFRDYNPFAFGGALRQGLRQSAIRPNRTGQAGGALTALRQHGLTQPDWGDAEAAHEQHQLYLHAIQVRKEMRQQLANRLADIPAAG